MVMKLMKLEGILVTHNVSRTMAYLWWPTTMLRAEILRSKTAFCYAGEKVWEECMPLEFFLLNRSRCLEQLLADEGRVMANAVGGRMKTEH